MNDKVTIDFQDIEVWPATQAVRSGGHDSILITEFDDKDAYHPALISEVIARANDPDRSVRLPTGLCGEKVYDVGSWEIPEATLINERAKAMFRLCVDSEDAVVDLSWASLYREGDYCMPHSHLRTTVSIVYFLDHGYTVSSASLDGRFCFVDPRIERCCGVEDGRMTTPFVPSATPGTMILFPSPMLHCVNPYFGNKPRISLSWDMDQRRLPGDPGGQGR